MRCLALLIGMGWGGLLNMLDDQSSTGPLPFCVTILYSPALPFYNFNLRASHARTLLPAALASVPFGFVLVRVRVSIVNSIYIYSPNTKKLPCKI